MSSRGIRILLIRLELIHSNRDSVRNQPRPRNLLFRGLIKKTERRQAGVKTLGETFVYGLIPSGLLLICCPLYHIFSVEICLANCMPVFPEGMTDLKVAKIRIPSALETPTIITVILNYVVAIYSTISGFNLFCFCTEQLIMTHAEIKSSLSHTMNFCPKASKKNKGPVQTWYPCPVLGHMPGHWARVVLGHWALAPAEVVLVH